MLDVPLGLVRAAIAEREPEVRAWRHLPDSVSSDVDGPLAGVPVGVKDIFDTADMPTECGSPIFTGRRPSADAWIVARLRALGAVIVGKTVTTEFAYFAPGPTRNPHDVSRTPGGSSSGSAAAVAAGMVPAAIGSQTAGSTTRPASFCGVTALAVSHGTFPSTGMSALAPSLDTLGLFTADVPDLRRLYSALRGRTQAPGRDLGSLRLLVADPPAELDPEMSAAFDTLRAALDDAGVPTDPLRYPLHGLAEDHSALMAYEAAHTLSVVDDHVAGLSEQLRALIERGRRVTDHRALAERRERHRIDMATAVRGYDAVLLPAATGPAPRGLDSTGDPILSRPWQLLGMPVLTLPGYRTRAGLPLGMQLVGAPGTDDALIETAAAVTTLLPTP